MRCHTCPAQGLRPGLLSDVPSGLKNLNFEPSPTSYTRVNPPSGSPFPLREGG
jgi:hypothetical protein